MDSFTFTCVLILTVLYGLCVGSFLNVVIYRLPNKIKMTNERSHCPKCHNMIRWYDNIPLLSYIILGGKCRKCKEKISYRYPLNEALNMVLWTVCLLLNRDNPYVAFVYAVICSLAICVFWIDVDHQLIFDRFNILIAVLGLAEAFLTACFVNGTYVPDFDKLVTELVLRVCASVAGGGVFLLVGLAVSKKAGKEALGGGDVKLMLAMGLLLGIGRLLLAVIISTVSALIVIEAVKRKKNYDSGHEYPFGPFLSFGMVVSMLFGSFIIEQYLSLFI